MTNLSNQTNNNQIYINSFQATDIHSHMYRENHVKSNFVGMLPYSLETIKLKEQEEFADTFTPQRQPNKECSWDVINVKFNQNVKSGHELLNLLPETILKRKKDLRGYKKDLKVAKTKAERTKLEDKIKRMNKSIEWHNATIKEIKANLNDDKWDKISSEDLRHNLYTKGFTLDLVDYETGETVPTDYKFYKRSSSKSREGEAVFIKSVLYDVMISWSRMGLELEEGSEIDLASLQAYSALVMSGIEDTIEIDPDSILLVDDVKLSFDETVNVVKDVNGQLDSVEHEDYKVTNEIFDGESLLCSSEFDEGTSMKLLRSHHYKAAAFSTNLQLWFSDYAEANGKDYDTWYIDDMFGNSIKVTDIKLVTNPSCLKALRFHEAVGSEKEMYEVWKQAVRDDNNVFGVCKHDAGSKLSSENNVVSNSTYQMLNSLPATRKDILEISKMERDYIVQLKDNDEAFIQFLIDNKTEVNSNEMFVSMYNKNKNTIQTQVFRDFRKYTIRDYVDYCKRGKLTIEASYVTLLSCPIEYLHHAVGETITKPLALKGNEVYSTLFDFDKTYTGMRNPHTQMNNIALLKNKKMDLIERYFELTKHVIVINTIGVNLLNIWSGADMDSDTILLINSPIINELSSKCYGHYNVCENGIADDPTTYSLTLEDMAKMDHTMAGSKIGEVVNLAQLVLSILYDKLNDGYKKDDEVIVKLQKQLDILSVLSGCAIDNAKRSYHVDLNKEIREIRSTLDLKMVDDEIARPNFWRYVYNDTFATDEDMKKMKFTHYRTAMDYVYHVMSHNIKHARRRENIDLNDLLVTEDKRAATRTQIATMNSLAEESEKASRSAGYSNSDDEMSVELEDVMEQYDGKFEELRVNEKTMYAILSQIADGKGGNVRLMNHLYKSQTKVFMDAFKEEYPNKK